MRKDITVAAEPRSTRGKNEARRLRARQSSPAILYGAGKDPVAVAVNPKDLNRILHSASGHNTIFNLDVQGVENSPVMIVDWLNDPIKGNLLHVDLKRIDLAKRLVVKVAMHVTGEPKGVKQQGGLLELVAREIELDCLPDDIPEHLTVDVTELMMGQSIRAGDVALSGSMKLVSPPDAVVAHVVALRAEVVETPAAEVAAPAAAAEPEVIKKGKKEEEAPAAEGEKKKK
jgi:large subunit ribosomal protein L25